jgi:predicted type IV restriction endonuclease
MESYSRPGYSAPKPNQQRQLEPRTRRGSRKRDSEAALARWCVAVRKRIQQIRDRNEVIGEQNTKAAPIDPLLSALGWDLQEINEVRREFRRKPQDNPVDYALFLNRTECLLLEAKSLEKDLANRKWISQNISYAAVVGVKWCVLTNGDEYRIYNSHAEVDVDEKLFRKVSISDSDPKFLVDTLLLLSKERMRGSLLDEMWKAHFIDRKVRLAFEALLGEDDGALVWVICKKANGVTHTEVRAALKRAKITVDFPVIKAPEQPIPPAPAKALGAPKAAARREAGRKVRETAPATSEATLLNLFASGLVRAPMELERSYKGVKLTASIQADGTVSFGGESNDSLSTAARMARKTVIHAPPDGHVLRPTAGRSGNSAIRRLAN